ncbi:hypothetical protein THIOKS12240006 [Thiocapsa sp. KS1]|nr:hypothetical protein THIOKS12240006 [Thiocapsa sp. KS1]
MDAVAKRVHRNRAGMRYQCRGFGFTLRVRDRVVNGDLLAPLFLRLGSLEVMNDCSF